MNVLQQLWQQSANNSKMMAGINNLLDFSPLKCNNGQMENTPVNVNPVKYAEIKEHLKNVIKTAKKLGLVVQPGGGYTMSYDINNLPPYPVGLYGALSIVEGPGARCKLGLTFDETESLEAGFNGTYPNFSKKKKKKGSVSKELMTVGAELSQLVYKRPTHDSWDVLDAPIQKKKQSYAFGEVSFAGQSISGKKKKVPKTAVNVNAAVVAELKKKQKAKILDEMIKGVVAKQAQAAPGDEAIKKEMMDKIVALADALNLNAADVVENLPLAGDGHPEPHVAIDAENDLWGYAALEKKVDKFVEAEIGGANIPGIMIGGITWKPGPGVM